MEAKKTKKLNESKPSVDKRRQPNQQPNTRNKKPTKNNYRDLEVWQKAMDLVVLCYEHTQSFPAEERYGLANQIRRAVVSIPSNIAEGQARQHNKEFVQFLSIAQGSTAEVETQIQIAERLEYLNSTMVQNILERTDQIARMITGLKKSLCS